MAPSTTDTGKGKSSTDPTQELVTAAQSLDTLLDRFEATIQSTRKVSADNLSPNPPDPLDVVHDAAKLLKAHTTKLSLFMINKPFTPSTIKQCIHEIASTVAPAMMSAIQICQPAKYSQVLHMELRQRVKLAFGELRNMMKEVIAQAPAGGTAVTDSKGQLPSTGVLWKACDELMAMKIVGLVGIVTAKAKQYQELIADALAELKDWTEDVEDQDVDDDEAAGSDGDSFGDMQERKLPADRKDLKETAEQAVKRLRYIESLYRALIKQRLAKFQSTPDSLSRLDDIMADLSYLPSSVDDIAFTLYEFENDEAQEASNAAIRKAKDVVEVASLDWKGQQDDFTAWSKKWLDLVDET